MLINKLIDHTILKATATQQDVAKICQEAIKYDFKSVCINPSNVELAKKLLEGSNVLVCTVIGFPLGANTIRIKELETEDAVKHGADEIDMVINVARAKEQDFKYIEEEIKRVVKAANGRLVKVILETCYLTDDEIVGASLAAKHAKADFVKTSTGFGTGGATVHHVSLMRKTVGEAMGVKASGGVRSLEDVLKMVEAGATRIGASSGVEIMNNVKSESNY